jgi:hypothetical protein
MEKLWFGLVFVGKGGQGQVGTPGINRQNRLNYTRCQTAFTQQIVPHWLRYTRLVYATTARPFPSTSNFTTQSNGPQTAWEFFLGATVLIG